jgi:glucose/arabinose dehydrogenase
MRRLDALIILAVLAGCGKKSEYPDAKVPYLVETIETPQGLHAETGGIAFLPDGRLVACFLRGEVMIYNPETKEWKLFAEGLHEPLGVLPLSESEILVMQKPELTRLKDTDGNGQADVYETVTDDFGMVGNYHEWTYGPVKDRDGNLYISFNTASEWGIIMDEVRGKLDTTLVPFKPKQKFAAVPYRGWVAKINSSGEFIPYAYGFRSPSGLLITPDNELFVADNQGDWVGTSPLFKVEQNKFYGHPASMIWIPGWNKGDPSKLPVEELNAGRERPVVQLPYGIIAASPTQPIFDNTDGAFGPFAGQILIGEMNQERIIRVMLEEVDGVTQGACVPFIDKQGLRKGNNRLAFSPDGSLYVGQVQHGFIGDTGIQRIVFTGKHPVDIYTMSITDEGFDLHFTQPMDEAILRDTSSFHFRHYYYEYHLKYGSDQFDLQTVPVKDVKVSNGGKTVSLKLESLKPGYIYELTMGALKSKRGEVLENMLVCYTVNVLRSGRSGAQPPPQAY